MVNPDATPVAHHTTPDLIATWHWVFSNLYQLANPSRSAIEWLFVPKRMASPAGQSTIKP
jgi:hypothetical protein